MSDPNKKPKKKKGRKVPPAYAGGAGASPEKLLPQLEAMYKRMGGLLMHADQQDAQIRKAAGAVHDQANKHIAALEKKIRSGQANEAEHRQYGELLKHRKESAGVLLKDRERWWDNGHTPPV